MLLATLLCYLGFTALSLSMSRHYADVIGGQLALEHRWRLRLPGWLALALSFWAAGQTGGWSIGVVQWFAALMASALVLLITMAWRPRLALWLAGVGLLISPFAAFSQWFA